VLDRTDKMGFPVPLTEWMGGEARGFVTDVLSSEAASGRDLINNRKALAGLDGEHRFGRKMWGLLSLELWQRAYHDRERDFHKLLRDRGVVGGHAGPDRRRAPISRRSASA
jgi:asparagine synthase (glutamine-hydrolysing)